MKLLALLALALLGSCSLLPDRVYSDVSNNPWDPRLTDTDEVVVTFGVEYDLAPQRVVIAGQQERHPWDAGAALGLWEGEEPSGPVPLVVEDDRIAETLAAVAAGLSELHDATISNARTMDALARDARAMREAFDRAESSWDSVNRTLLGGGGLTTLLLLLLGRRRLWPAKREEEDPSGG